jgi:hypothetical protein
MSNINELIHTTSMHAYDQGVKYERERIVRLLERLDLFGSIDIAFVPEIIALIKGENK